MFFTKNSLHLNIVFARIIMSEIAECFVFQLDDVRANKSENAELVMNKVDELVKNS